MFQLDSVVNVLRAWNYVIKHWNMVSSLLQYVSKKMTLTFGTFSKMCSWCSLRCKLEGFFRRALSSYTHKFPKRDAVLLTDLPELRLCLLSCLCNGKVDQQRKGFCKCSSFLKTRTITTLPLTSSVVWLW